ncbi:MAG: CAP domain-containing protein [Ignavibacteria bacterium]|jgi:hypothetical protein|nr:CAP domain-containing protein [Ignavibacteria bacterium]
MKSKILFITLCICLNIPLNAQMFEITPDIATCTQGKISAEVRDSVLALLNQIRAVHKLNPVTWNDIGEDLAQAASLSIANSGIMVHTPVADNCATPSSDSGRKYSNISLGLYRSRDMSDIDKLFNSTIALLGWLTDNKNVADLSMVGHRRMLLSPFLQTVGFGAVKANLNATNARYAAALWGNTKENLDTSTCPNNYVAYPYEEYKSEWFNKKFYLSLNLIPKSNKPFTSISYDFSKCNISITDEKGRKYKASGIKYSTKIDEYADTFYCGLSNNLCWKVNGLKDNTKYFVAISGLVFEGEEQVIEYWFILDKPIPPKVVRKRRR